MLWKLREYKRNQEKLAALWVVEGESDCWALWHHGYPAIGIPGATHHKAIDRIQADYLAGFPEVIIWQEPDQGGSHMALKVLDRVEQIYKGKITVVAQDTHKDPCVAFQKGSLAWCYDAGACTPKEFRAEPKENTQLAVSQSFARQYTRGRFRHNPALGGWLAWDGAAFVPNSDHRIYLRAVEYMGHLGQQALAVKNEEARVKQVKFVKSLATTDKISSTIKGATAFLHVEEGDLDANPLVVNLRNGWYDLKGNEFHPHGKPAPFTRTAGTHHDEKADCPLWKTCVADYWDDQEVRRYLRQQCGLLLAGETHKHMVYFYGAGNNGKSMVVELVRCVLGGYAAVLDVEDLLLKGQQGVPYGMANLRGVRLVTTSELPDGARLNEGLLKRITGGNTIQARQIYGKPFEFLPQFKLWFDGNFKPSLSTDEATWGRFHLLPFAKQFARDNSLLGRLKTEAAGVLNWMIDGWKDYQENGLFYPAALEDQKEEFKKECDHYAAFLEEFFDRETDGRVARRDAYNLFTSWWRAIKPSSHIPEETKFARECRRCGLGEQMSNGKRYWKGIQPSARYQEWWEQHNPVLC